MFNKHRVMFESGELNTDVSKICFLLPSIIDRSEEINKYISYVNIYPIDIVEKKFRENYDPSKLDFTNDKKAETIDCVANIFKKIKYQIQIQLKMQTVY